MYGYVVPVKEKLSQADFCLYRAFYCGICKATGRGYGQLPRFTTNYDMVFLSVLLHDVTTQEVRFESKGCVCNPFQKKTTVCGNALLDKLVAANLILSYHKATDDVIDEGAKKKAARRLLRRAYRKARTLLPAADEIATRQYARLRDMERRGESGIDRVADCFATLLMQVAEVLLDGKAEEPLLKLCYNVGKFVYLADALDDADEDSRKKRYNPLIAHFGPYEGRQAFIERNRDDLRFLFASTVNRAIACFNKLHLTQASDLLANIVRQGLRDKADQIFASKKKLPKPRI